jgi:hypothetical protein
MLKPGDTIVIDGNQSARVRAIRSPDEMIERMPQCAGIFIEASQEGVKTVLLMEIDAEPQDLAVIMQTPAGWQTMEGETITVTPAAPQN